MKTGPNDTSGVVWAISKFSIISLFLINTNNIFRDYYLFIFKSVRKAVAEEMGDK